MYFTGTAANTIGGLLAAIHSQLLTAGWSYLGDQAANKKVYSSPGSSGTDFVLLLVDDSNIGYTGFQAGTAYDDGTKIFSNPTTIRYLQKALTYSTPYWMMANLDRIVISAKCLRGALLNYCSLYAGLVTRYKPSDTGAIIIFGSTASATALGLAHNTAMTGLAVQILKDYTGALNKTAGATALNCNFGSGQLPNVVDGKMIISPIIVGISTGEITGELIGVYSINGSQIAPEDTLTKDADTYLCMFTGTYYIAILQA